MHASSLVQNEKLFLHKEIRDGLKEGDKPSSANTRKISGLTLL